jgi:hypothetical protein
MLFLAAATFAAAQITTPTTDVLGAHLNYGRGCAACHAPHSGAFGNGNNKSGDTTTGNVALWGEDVGNLYGKPIVTGQMDNGASYTETLPTALTATTPDVGGVLMCLSCHDGNYAQGAMMKNKVYESLPSTYGTGTIPTLLGNDGTGTGNYLNDHPVGLNAVMGCTGPYNWDCTVSATGSVQMTGTHSAQFVTDYGFFVSPGNYNNTPVVLCTTCHNQHVMTVYTSSAASPIANDGGGKYYATFFFVNGPYNPNINNVANTSAPSTTQFCRQCHFGEANESNNTNGITTVFQ